MKIEEADYDGNLTKKRGSRADKPEPAAITVRQLGDESTVLDESDLRETAALNIFEDGSLSALQTVRAIGVLYTLGSVGLVPEAIALAAYVQAAVGIIDYGEPTWKDSENE